MIAPVAEHEFDNFISGTSLLLISKPLCTACEGYKNLLEDLQSAERYWKVLAGFDPAFRIGSIDPFDHKSHLRFKRDHAVGMENVLPQMYLFSDKMRLAVFSYPAFSNGNPEELLYIVGSLLRSAQPAERYRSASAFV